MAPTGVASNELISDLLSFDMVASRVVKAGILSTSALTPASAAYSSLLAAGIEKLVLPRPEPPNSSRAPTSSSDWWDWHAAPEVEPMPVAGRVAAGGGGVEGVAMYLPTRPACSAFTTARSSWSADGKRAATALSVSLVTSR
jgi:hypothetical protein